MSHYHQRLQRHAFRCSIIVVLGFTQTLNLAFASIDKSVASKSDWFSHDTANLDSVFSLVGEYSVGAVSDIEVQDDIVYFNSGPFWVVTDVSEPAHPVERARLRFNEGTRFIVENDLAYISDRENLYVFDVSDPADPQQRGAIGLRGAPEDLVVQNGFLFIAAHIGLFIIDVNNPSAPEEVGWLYSYTFSYSGDEIPLLNALAIRDTLAYVGTDEGLHLVDISDVSNLAEVSFIPAPGIFDVALEEDLIYLGGYRFHVVDLSDLDTPRLLTTLELGTRSHEVTIKDGYAYLADSEHGLRVLDLRVPAQPILLSTLNASHLGFALAVGAEQAYVAALASGVRIVDLSHPAQPAEVGTIDTFDGLYGFSVEDDIAYVAASRAGLLIIDLSDPARPKKMASYKTGDDAHSDVVVDNGIAYVVGSAVHMIDVSDPARPTKLGAIDVGGGILRNMTLANGIAYISGEGGLHLYDVADPAAPKALGSLSFCERWESCALDLVVENEIVYLVDFYNVVRLVDVSNPMQPTLIGHIDLPDYVRNVAVQDHLVFITTDTFLYIINAADPGAPVELAVFDLNTSTGGVTVSKSHAYVSARRGINLVDITNPSSPHLIGHYPTEGLLREIIPQGEFVYVSTSDSFLALRHEAVVSSTELPPSVDQVDYIRALSGYPNPFSSQVTLEYRLLQAGQVQVSIYDILGRGVRVLSDSWRAKGLHEIVWDGLDQQGNKMPSGVYFYRVTMNKFSKAGQLVLLP